MNWTQRDLRRAADELVELLTAALERMDRAGYARGALPPLEETTAGSCWNDHRQAVA